MLLGLNILTPPPPDELERIAQLACRDYLLYWRTTDSLADWARVQQRLRDADPAGRFHLRIEARGQLDIAGDLAALNRCWETWGATLATVRIRNEPNIESRGVTPSQWYNHLMVLADRLVPDIRRRLYVPAVSPSGNWQEWLDYIIESGISLLYAGLDCHAYGAPDQIAATLAEYRLRWPGKLLLTETNPGAGQVFAHYDWALSLPRLVITCKEHDIEAPLLFAWSWRADMPLPTPVDVCGSPVEAAVRVYNQSARLAEKTLEPTPPLSTQYPVAYAEWVNAGGIQANFRKHALALGVIRPTAADVPFLESELESCRRQLELVKAQLT